MQSATARFSSLVALAHTRHVKRMQFAWLMAVLIAFLLWRTQWPMLWPGLWILLAGQIGAALFLIYRLRSGKGEENISLDGSGLQWFDKEETFLKRLFLFENLVRILGFLVLAYGFWLATRSLGIAIALGLIYPIIVYFGIGRRNNIRNIRQLQSQKNEIQTLVSQSGPR